jgi:hypothetical protein
MLPLSSIRGVAESQVSAAVIGLPSEQPTLGPRHLNLRPVIHFYRNIVSLRFPKLYRPTRLNRDVRLEHPGSSVAADARPWTSRLCSLQESSLGHVATASSEALVIASALCLLFKLARPPTCADTTWQHVWW